MNKKEALADAITHYSGFLDPETTAYKARNPGRLKTYTMRHLTTDGGLRVFSSLSSGYEALLFDLDVKCKGRSHSGLKGDSPLKELCYAMDFPDETVRYIVKYVRKATGDPSVSEDTVISYFVEE